MLDAKMKKRALVVDAALKKIFPNARIALKFKNNWELLVAVVLSAQCTDKKVNEVTEKLFKKYKTLDDYVEANPSEFERDIKSTGFFRNKTKSILGAARMLKEKYSGQIPKEMHEITKLPGVGRKSANIILGNAHGIVEGIAVDTHVKRLAKVLGLTKNDNPDKIEKDLMELIPRVDWFGFTYRLIDYGRKYCSARPHDHENCPLTKIISKI